MDYNELRNEYITETYSHNETVKAIETRRWVKVGEQEQQMGLTVEELSSKEDFVKLLSGLGIYSSSSLYSLRYSIIKYLTWLEENKGIKANKSYIQSISYEELNNDDDYKSIYFASFSQLQKALKDVIDSSDRYSKDSFLSTKVMIYLFWFGVTTNELMSIKKSDVDVANSRIYINLTDRYVQLPAPVMKTVSEYENSDGFETRAKTIIFLKYKPSIYLFRTNKNPQLNAIMIKKMLFRLNALTESPKFKYDPIRKSGIFNRAYSRELENGMPSDLDSLKEMFCEDFSSRHDADLRKRDYEFWKSMFI